MEGARHCTKPQRASNKHVAREQDCGINEGTLGYSEVCNCCPSHSNKEADGGSTDRGGDNKKLLAACQVSEERGVPTERTKFLQVRCARGLALF